VNATAMKILIECSVLCVLVGCIIAQSDVNDASTLKHVVSEILRRLDEKDAQIEKQQQRIVEQETLNAEQNNRLADQDAIIAKLQQSLVQKKTLNAEQNNRIADHDAIIEKMHQQLQKVEPERAFSGEIKKTANQSMSSNDIGGKSILPEKSTTRRSKYMYGVYMTDFRNYKRVVG